ncbi:zinc finger matrin-type protein 1 isoform X2 [Denticeps clupeoides]|uniref:zinc finger matrin-type protein 1 isoform X2 n=1 Tax=Denticeps clupeoides TaxID=299321 RepID=UPI0010A4DFC3|nr:zinc finger matrin-type protein 1-like isoform X2 [Denticeps clupeoides]
MAEIGGDSSSAPHNAETDAERHVATVTSTYNTSARVEDGPDPLKTLLTDGYCHICEAVLMFESQRVSHYEGKKHAQNMRLYLQSKKHQQSLAKVTGPARGLLAAGSEKFCELCNMVFSSAVVAKSHYAGKVHAKNRRRFGAHTPQTDGDVSRVPNTAKECEETPGPKDPVQPVTPDMDLNDPNRHCRMCAATFNTPLMAKQHYSGRKHQRKQSRQVVQQEMGPSEDSGGTLTCPVCGVSLSSVEMYQSHMQGNKHQLQEKKVGEVCKSRRKVYDTFQDELADYIQVQKSRGLEPKASPGTQGGMEGEEQKEDETGEVDQRLALLRPVALFSSPPSYAPPHFQPPGIHFPFWRSGSAQAGQWRRGFAQPYQMVRHPDPTVQRPMRRRSSESFSPSSSSDSSSSDDSSYSSSSDYERERRRQKRKQRRDRGGRERDDEEEEKDSVRKRRAREQEDEEPGDKTSKRKRQRSEDEGQVEEEKEKRSQRKRRERERSKREGGPGEEEDERKRRRQKRRNQPHRDQCSSKKKREDVEKASQNDTPDEVISTGMEGHTHGRTTAENDERPQGRTKEKVRKEKKRMKDRMAGADTRTEEEKLWDETVLGMF